jgi:hypothetical protein
MHAMCSEKVEWVWRREERRALLRNLPEAGA